MAITFEDYIKATGILIINVIIRDNSKITIERALNIVRSRVNRNADKFPDLDVKAQLTDFRNGNIYEVFSDRWLDKYNQTSWWNLQLDKEAIDRFLNENKSSKSDNLVYTDSVLIDSENGEKIVYLDNDGKDFNVFLKVEDDANLKDIKVVLSDENYEEGSFKITIYDTSTFMEEKRDCSKDPINVNYLVVYTNGNAV